ncbi:hypothetical protein DV451_004250 [Geotrichum candidum]|uniref:Uncharacterized protein n=1 Tax=Geotrichum candidum TaxID=1173061 RepID=A0A9P5G2G7_GEOCN|nr:hypothetical protein DV451_004250 [Geotrichum candidum]
MSKLSNGLSFSSNPGFYKLPVADVSQSNLRLTPLTTRHYSAYTVPVDDSHNNDCGNGLNNSAYSLSDHSTILLRQYANSKDIPVGALLHILACCQNIIIADLSNVQLADDYYVTEAKLYPAKANSGMIFVSDVARLHFWPDEHIRTATPETVVTSVAALRMLRTVNIKNVTWLTKGQVARMLESVASVEGEGVECDFRGSGLARGLEWAVKGSVEELRKQIEVS